MTEWKDPSKNTGLIALSPFLAIKLTQETMRLNLLKTFSATFDLVFILPFL